MQEKQKLFVADTLAKRELLSAKLEGEEYAPSLHRLLWENSHQLVKIGIHPFFHRLWGLDRQDARSLKGRAARRSIREYEDAAYGIFKADADFANTFFVFAPPLEGRSELDVARQTFKERGVIMPADVPVIFSGNGTFSRNKEYASQNKTALDAIMEMIRPKGMVGAFIFGLSREVCVGKAFPDIENLFVYAEKPVLIAINRLACTDIWDMCKLGAKDFIQFALKKFPLS